MATRPRGSGGYPPGVTGETMDPAPLTVRARGKRQRSLLRVGDMAPEIDAVTTKGARFVLSKSPRPFIVLYFFPRAFTPGCTREAELFRDSHAELALAGADVVGISTDDHETQCDFAASTQVNFPLIADVGGVISRAYGVLWPLIHRPKRITLVLDRTRKVLATFRHEVRIKKHRDDVLAFVDGLFRARQAERES